MAEYKQAELIKIDLFDLLEHNIRETKLKLKELTFTTFDRILKETREIITETKTELFEMQQKELLHFNIGVNKKMKLIQEKVIQLDQIIKEPVFENLYPLYGGDYQDTKDDMTDNGYNPAYPIFTWERSPGEYVLWEGHRRVHIGEKLGMTEFPAKIFLFESFEETLEAALKTIRGRSNKEDYNIYHAVCNLYEERSPGQRSGYGPESQRLAKLMGTNKQKITYSIALMKKGKADEIQTIIDGGKINNAYNEMKKRIEGPAGIGRDQPIQNNKTGHGHADASEPAGESDTTGIGRDQPIQQDQIMSEECTITVKFEAGEMVDVNQFKINSENYPIAKEKLADILGMYK